MTAVAAAVLARRGAPVRMVAEREERRDVAVGLEHDVTAGTAVAAVGSTLGNVRLPAERDGTGTAVAAAHVHLDLVDEHPALQLASQNHPIGGLATQVRYWAAGWTSTSLRP